MKDGLVVNYEGRLLSGDVYLTYFNGKELQGYDINFKFFMKKENLWGNRGISKILAEPSLTLEMPLPFINIVYRHRYVHV